MVVADCCLLPQGSGLKSNTQTSQTYGISEIKASNYKVR